MADSASPALLVPPGADLRELIPGLPELVTYPKFGWKPREPVVVLHPLEPVVAEWPVAPVEWPVAPVEWSPAPGTRLAVFLVATSNRPQLLAAVLHHLSLQQVPAGWDYEIMVAGQANDPGKDVVTRYARARFFATESSKVTDKLNHLAKSTEAELLLMADDDDLQPPNRLAAAVRAFDQGAQWSGTGLHRFLNTTTGAMARWDGKAISGHVGTSISITRQLFLKVGGYPSVAAGKDGHLEYRIRTKATTGRFADISGDIGEGLICLQHGNNINTRPFPKKGKKRRKGKFSIVGEGHWTSANLPAEIIRSIQGLTMAPRGRWNEVTATLASIPARRKALKQVVASLLPQVDRLCVYLNGYADVPEFLDHPRIIVARSQDHGDRGAAGKMFWCEALSGFHFVCDDDIIYPPDYVRRTTQSLAKQGYRAAVSYHGSRLRFPISTYHSSRQVLHCMKHVGADTPAHVIGTGVLAYHTDLLRLQRADFPVPNMVDVAFALVAQRKRIPLLVLAHKGRWLRFIKGTVGNSIFAHAAQPKLLTEPRDVRRSTSDVNTQTVLSWPRWQLHGTAQAPPLRVIRKQVLTILIAAFNAVRWLPLAVESVLEQRLPTGWRLQVLIGVDNHPATSKVAHAIHDPRVGVVDMVTNGGPYFVRNTLELFTQGELVQSVDADDTIPPGRLFKFIRAFEANPNLSFVNSWYSTVGENHATELVKGPAFGVWMFRRKVLDRLGGYYNWRCAADSEFVRRGFAAGLRSKVLPESLYDARQSGGQLTRHKDTNNKSPVRLRHSRRIKRDQAGYKRGKPVPCLSPERGAIGKVTGNLMPDHTMVVAALACIPSRAKTLPRVVESLLPQVDRLCLYLNGYGDVPEFLKHPRITVARSQDHGDRGDAGKMFWTGQDEGYYLTCDDDIIYPPDYVAQVVRGIEKYHRKAAVGFHGNVLVPPIHSYIRSKRSIRFSEPLSCDTPAHILGTGVAGFHTDTIRVRPSDFALPNMADNWFGVLSQQQRVPLVVLAHPGRWLRNLDYYADSIFSHSDKAANTSMDVEMARTKLTKRHMPWTLFPLPSERAFDQRVRQTLSHPETPMSDYYDSFYAKGGWNYEPTRPAQITLIRDLVAKAAGWPAGGHILEVGCGKGFHASLLHELGFRVTALDKSSVGIEAAKAQYKGPTFVAGQLQKYTPSEPVDGIFARGMSWFLYNMDAKLAARCERLFEWIKPGGTFVLQIVTTFSGARPTGKIHQNTVADYLSVLQPLGAVVACTDWEGKPLQSGDKGVKGVIIAIRKPSEYTEAGYWEDNYLSGKGSGSGSEGKEARWKVRQVVAAAKQFGVASILDLGCGDGRIATAVGKALPELASFQGLDISPTAVRLNQTKALPNQTFKVKDFGRKISAKADLVICFDVLFHQSTQRRHDMVIANVCRSFKKVALVVAWNDKIVEKYQGAFAKHTFYRPFTVPPEIQVTEVPCPMEPAKTLYLLSRPGGD